MGALGRDMFTWPSLQVSGLSKGLHDATCNDDTGMGTLKLLCCCSKVPGALQEQRKCENGAVGLLTSKGLDRYSEAVVVPRAVAFCKPQQLSRRDVRA